mgnify:CR=1 FL=1
MAGESCALTSTPSRTMAELRESLDICEEHRLRIACDVTRAAWLAVGMSEADAAYIAARALIAAWPRALDSSEREG